MRKNYDDFTQMKMKDMCKCISDMTYKYIDPETNVPTVVPASHYEKQLSQVQEQYVGEIVSREILNVIYKQLCDLKKENEKYFNQALLCMDMNLNPKDLRINEQVALEYTNDYISEKQKVEKKNFCFLNEDIVNAFEETKTNPQFQSQAVQMSNEIEESRSINFGKHIREERDER